MCYIVKIWKAGSKYLTAEDILAAKYINQRKVMVKILNMNKYRGITLLI